MLLGLYLQVFDLLKELAASSYKFLSGGKLGQIQHRGMVCLAGGSIHGSRLRLGILGFGQRCDVPRQSDVCH